MGDSASGASGCCLKVGLMRIATCRHKVLRTPCPAGWGQASLEGHSWPVPTSALPQPRSRLDWVTWVKEREEPCQPALEKGVLSRASPKLRHRAPCKAEEGAPWADAVLPDWRYVGGCHCHSALTFCREQLTQPHRTLRVDRLTPREPCVPCEGHTQATAETVSGAQTGSWEKQQSAGPWCPVRHCDPSRPPSSNWWHEDIAPTGQWETLETGVSFANCQIPVEARSAPPSVPRAPCPAEGLTYPAIPSAVSLAPAPLLPEPVEVRDGLAVTLRMCLVPDHTEPPLLAPG